MRKTRSFNARMSASPSGSARPKSAPKSEKSDRRCWAAHSWDRTRRTTPDAYRRRIHRRDPLQSPQKIRFLRPIRPWKPTLQLSLPGPRQRRQFRRNRNRSLLVILRREARVGTRRHTFPALREPHILPRQGKQFLPAMQLSHRVPSTTSGTTTCLPETICPTSSCPLRRCAPSALPGDAPATSRGGFGPSHRSKNIALDVYPRCTCFRCALR